MFGSQVCQLTVSDSSPVVLKTVSPKLVVLVKNSAEATHVYLCVTFAVRLIVIIVLLASVMVQFGRIRL